MINSNHRLQVHKKKNEKDESDINELNELNNSVTQPEPPQSPHRTRQAVVVLGKSTPIDVKLLRAKCTIQLGLIDAVNEIISSFYSVLSVSHFTILLDSLQICYLVSDKDLLQQFKPPHTELLDLLIKEETSAISCLLKITARMYADPSEELVELSEPILIRKSKFVLENFYNNVNNNTRTPEMERITGSYVPLALQILRIVQEFEQSQFKEHLPEFYPLFSNLILIQSKEIRSVLRELFIEIGKVGLPPL